MILAGLLSMGFKSFLFLTISILSILSRGETKRLEPIDPELWSPLSPSEVSPLLIQKVQQKKPTQRYAFLKQNLLPTPKSTSVRIPLFDGTSLNVQVKKVENKSQGGFSLWGAVLGKEESQQVVMWIHPKKKILMANIFWEGKSYQVRPLGNQRLILTEEDTCSSSTRPLEVEIPELEARSKLPESVRFDDGSTIDILVAYTAAAKAAQEYIEDEIQIAVDQANQVFENSKIHTRLRLVYTTPVDYVESTQEDMGVDLLNLATAINNPEIARIHELRDEYGADIVSLWLVIPEPPEGERGHAGQAFRMPLLGHWFGAWAFNVIDASKASSYTLVHEVGHNMSADHDWYISAGDPLTTWPAPYIHGYIYIDPNQQENSWKTIMAYSDYCETLNVDCELIPYFSNPDLTYKGVPLGISGENANDHPANNARALNEAAFVVANFRKSKTEAGEVSFSSYQVDDDTIGPSQGNGDGVIDPGETIELGIILQKDQIRGIREMTADFSADNPSIEILSGSALSFQEVGDGKYQNAQPLVFRVSSEREAYVTHVYLDILVDVFGGRDREFKDSFQLEINYDIPLITNPYNQASIAIHDQRIVWVEGKEIHLYDLETQEETLIVSGVDICEGYVDLKIFGDIIIWIDTPDCIGNLYLYDLGVDTDGDGIPNYRDSDRPEPDPAKVIVTDTSYAFGQPQIYKDKIVWTEINFEEEFVDIYLYDLGVDTDEDGIPNYLDSDSQGPNDPARGKIKYSADADQSLDLTPAIYDDKIVWYSYNAEGHTAIYLYDLRTDTDEDGIPNYLDSDQQGPNDPAGVSVTGAEMSFIDVTGLNIFGPIILWRNNEAFDNTTFTLYLYNLSVDTDQDGIPNYLDADHPTPDPAKVQITMEGRIPQNPFLYEGKIFWDEDRNGNRDIYLYDLSTDSDSDGIPNYLDYDRPVPDPAEFQMTVNPSEQLNPAANGEILIWQDDRNGNDDIYLTKLPTPP